MTVTWLALSAAVLLVPSPAVAPMRARALTGRAPQVRARLPTQLPVPPVPPALRTALVACAVIAPVLAGWSVGGPALAVAAAVAGLTILRLVADAGARRARRRRDRDLLLGVRLLVAEVEAGARPASALCAAAEAAPSYTGALAAAGSAAAEGADVAGVLLGHPALAPIAQAWRLAESAGAPLADVLGGVALDLAARADQARSVAAALSAARSTAVLLAGLPVLGIGLGIAMGARPMPFLIQTSAGHLVCCAGVLLDAAGLLWTRGLARRAEASA